MRRWFARTHRVLRVVARPAYSNPINPYNRLLYDGISATGTVEVIEHRYHLKPWDYDALHIHWPEVIPRSVIPKKIAKSIVEWSWLVAAKIVGTKILWTAHNAFPHDTRRSKINLFLWGRFLSLVDGVIFLSEQSRERILHENPILADLPFSVIKHGHYGPWISEIKNGPRRPTPQIIAALDRLESYFTVVNVGQILPYKNIEGLIRQFSTLSNPEIRLVIAGGCVDSSYKNRIRQLANLDSRVVALLENLDDASLVACIDRADLVVLPYHSVQNSGLAIMSLSLRRHILVPSAGSMGSLRDDVGQRAVSLYQGPFCAAALIEAIDRVRSGGIEEPNLSQLDWHPIALDTIKFYSTLVRGS